MVMSNRDDLCAVGKLIMLESQLSNGTTIVPIEDHRPKQGAPKTTT